MTPKPRPHRVVFDTNILLSALIFGGKPEAAWQLARSGEIVLVTSPAILAELARVLREKFSWAEADVADAIKTVGYSSELVKPTVRISVLGDPADNRILGVAVDGHADAIVSGDRHLIELGNFQGMPVVRAADLLRSF